MIANMEELLSLKWNNHRSTFIHILGILRDKQLYTDATIACEGKFYSVHKLVLSTCSDYFSSMLDRTSCKNPVIVLNNIKSEDLEALLDYMYLGEVNVRQSDLATLIKAAECLRVKGLAVPDDEPPARKPTRSNDSQSRRGDTSSTPPAKRKRRSDIEDGREDVRNSRPDIRQPSPSQRSVVSRSKSPAGDSTSALSPVNNRTTSVKQQDASLPPPESPKTSQDGTTDLQPTEQTEQFVKVEMDDGGADVEAYDISNDGAFKEEGSEGGASGGVDGAGGDLSSDLPEFLQQAAGGGGSLQGGAFEHSSFSSGSSFQPNDMTGWQGDGSNVNFSQINFNASEGGSGQQNTQGSPFMRGAARHSTTNSSFLECKQCGKRCYGRNKKQNLAHHMITHNNDRSSKCPQCPYRASSASQLLRHRTVAHCIPFPSAGGDIYNAISGVESCIRRPDDVLPHLFLKDVLISASSGRDSDSTITSNRGDNIDG